MPESSLDPPKPRRRWPLPRFSLAAALVAMTLCAIGLWYWYRVPFEVVHDRDRSAQFRKRDELYREVETVHRTWDGTVRHGPRRIYLNDKLYFVENYRDGVPHGQWEWLDGAGRATITADFRLGQLESFRASPECDQRLARLLAEGEIRDSWLARVLLQDARGQFIETPLKDALHVLQDSHGVAIELLGMLKAPDFSIDMPITCQTQGPLIQVLGQILQPHDLVCDYRYGLLYVVEREGVENWKDETGMAALMPDAGSNLGKLLQEKALMEFIETPLVDALRILKDAHGVKFDWSRLPSELVQPQSRRSINVTINVSGVTLKDCLGALFDVYDLQASLDGETIVIEVQPDHPAAQSRER